MTIDPTSAIYMLNHGDPSDEARFREEFYNEPREEAPVTHRTTVSRATENLIRARNTVRIGRFIRLV